MSTSERKQAWRFEVGSPLQEAGDDLAAEEPLEIRVRGRSVAITMRTPDHDDELAAGFLLTEGIIRAPDDVVRIEPCASDEQDNVVNVTLAPEVAVDFERLTRHVFTSSSCGLCGKVSQKSASDRDFLANHGASNHAAINAHTTRLRTNCSPKIAWIFMRRSVTR